MEAPRRPLANGDTNYTSVGSRGNPTNISTPSGGSTLIYNLYGIVTSNTTNGVTSTSSTTSTTNYAAPDSITVNRTLTTSMTYSSFLGPTNETGPNTTGVDIGYDAYPNHRCEKCLRCSDCCQCELRRRMD